MPQQSRARMRCLLSIATAFSKTKELLKEGTTIIALGTGGVGKTAMPVALALAGASHQFNTAVVTVDPARRLRDVLGLQRLGGKPTRIGSRKLKAVFFVLVTTPEEDRLRQPRLLVEEMNEERLTLAAVIVNGFADEETWKDSHYRKLAPRKERSRRRFLVRYYHVFLRREVA